MVEIKTIPDRIGYDKINHKKGIIDGHMGRPHKPMPLILNEDDTYPSVRMVEIRTIPDRIGYVKLNHKKSKTIINGQMEDYKEGGLFFCIARKRLMSKEHANIFRKSIMESGSYDEKGVFWMFNYPTTWVRYSCGVQRGC